ncbi:WXG100 family type VII secretion target [Streptomyces tsukubensis]|uniref:WXG100 family type VII secretion target n=1 Tax=Streptomyces tsukubensis TaxID=83656 RepID=A0A1V4A7C1_9ACTN|nr:WXG100 family type VII secretion target [Streptomyces tsukubensis]OON77023.1 WXG100 family type VII secretion target [Streptomyces tsukubensis]QFR93737.1 WXG100 family type VII secretion target [Streptomyces tsukubensis]
MAEQPPTTSVGGVQYRVTPEYLANASADAERTASEIAAELQQIKTYVLSLEADWQGIAHNQFQTLMQEYDNYAQMLHRALHGISQGLKGSYINYSESESQNLSNLTALGADIPSPGGGGSPTPTNFS